MAEKKWKIINTSKLKEAKEDYGILLRDIEYYSNNKDSKRVDVLRIMKKAIEFRDKLNAINPSIK